MNNDTEPRLRLKSKTNRLHQLLRDNRGVRYFFIALGLLLATGIGLLVWMSLNQPDWGSDNSKIIRKEKPPVYYSPLTGIEVKSEAVTSQQVTAIMIENSPEARPQSGLKQAGVVFEAVAEGGITRFVALYQESKPQLIGPVRSVRPYYVEWAAAFDPSMAHIGGSYKALQMIRSGKYGHDIDQFFNADSYWRSSDRYAPHNVYTSFKRLDALNKRKGYASSKFEGFERLDKAQPVKKPSAKNISINVSSGSYAVSYSYDIEHNHYIRKQGGVKHVDREKGQITPKVVIAMKVPMSLGFEDGYREQIKTTGKGEAFIFQNGTVIKATWSKASATSQIHFTDSEGDDIELTPGQTWITALAKDRSVSWR